MTALIIALFAAAFLLLFLLMPQRPAPGQARAFLKRNFAHRGLYTQDQSVPENSPAAFRAAVAGGYGIELDIQLSKDGQVVVFHDDTLDRVCGVHGRVDAFTCEELREMPLYGTDQRMPLFTEVLSLVDGRVPLIVEIKTSPRNAELCEKAWGILLQYTGAFCVESFDPRIVAWWRKYARQVLRGQLSSSWKDLRKNQSAVLSFILSRCLMNVIARPHFIAFHKEQRNVLVKLAYKLGALPVVYTAQPQDDTRRLEQENAAVIFEYYKPRIRY